MARSKDLWLRDGAGDLEEADVEDVPVKGESVRVRGLPAAYSNQASSEALVMKTVGRGDQIATVDTGRLEVLQFAHGVIDPKFSIEESEQIAKHFGPAFKKVIAKIDEISGVDKEAIERANARFPSSGARENGKDLGTATPAGGAGPDLPARASSGTQEKRS